MIFMPLYMFNSGEHISIKKVIGKEEIKKFLENLGFVTGAVASVISRTGDGMIVNVKNSRVAISRDMANKIIV
jgi:ferrous iron transport protein A